MTTLSPGPSARPTGLGLGVALVSAVAFGATGPFAKAMINAGWTPETVVLLRILGTAIVLTPFAFAAGWPIRHQLRAADARLMVLYGVIALAGVQVCFFNSVERLPVSVGLLIEYLAPVLLVIGSSLLTRTLPPRLVAAGAVMATAGLVPVLNLQVDGGIDIVGVIWSLAAALCLCAYFVLTARSAAHVPQTLLIWAGCWAGSAVIGTLGLTGVLELHRGGTTVILGRLHFSWLLAVAFLVVVCTAVAYLSGMIAIRMLGNRRASFLALTEVLFAALSSWLLLGQTLTVLQVLGAVLVVGGIVLVQRGTAGPAAQAAPEPVPAAA